MHSPHQLSKALSHWIWYGRAWYGMVWHSTVPYSAHGTCHTMPYQIRCEKALSFAQFARY